MAGAYTQSGSAEGGVRLLPSSVNQQDTPAPCDSVPLVTTSTNTEQLDSVN